MHALLGDKQYFYLRRGPRPSPAPPLLVLHGGPGFDHTTLRPWLDGLGAQRELIYVDSLGCGRSEPQATLTGHGIEAAIQHLEALRRHLKLERWLILGHGFGGFEAQAYALAQPAACAGLILCNCAPAFDYPHDLINWAQRDCNPAQLAALVQMLTQQVGDDAALHALYQTMLPLFFYRYDLKVGTAMQKSARFSAAGFNYGMFELAARIDLREPLRQMRVPTLILGGQHDWLMPPAQGAHRLHKNIVGSTLTLFDESGHFPFIEEPVSFNNVLKHWLAAHVT